MAKLRHVINRTYLLALVLLIGVGVSVPAMAAHEAPKSVAGEVVFAVGDAYVITPSGPEKAAVGGVVMAGDRLVTGVDGFIHLRMADGAFLGIRSNSLLEINEYMFDAKRPENSRVRLFLQEGTVRAISGHIVHQNKQSFRLNTPLAAIGVRGTDFVTAADQWNTQVAVAAGGVAMAPYGSECIVADLGPCLGDNVTDLYANQPDAFLVVKRGQLSAQIINSDLESLIAPPHPQEKYDSSSNLSSSDAATINNRILDVLTFVVQRSLTEQDIQALNLLPEDAASAPQSLVQIDSLELIRLANDVGSQPAYRQKLDQKVVNIQDQAFDIVTQSRPLFRFFDQTGMLAWSETADSTMFDQRINFMQNGQSYQVLMAKVGLGNYLQGFGMEAAQVDAAMGAWDAYYAASSQGSIAQLGASDLYHAAGLKVLQTPALNRYFPAVNLVYDTVDTKILTASNEITIGEVSLKINHNNGVFEATVAIHDVVNGAQDYLVTGSLNSSGMVFGGHQNVALEGLVIADTGQVATLLHYDNSGVSGDALLLFDDASLSWPEAAIEAAPALYKVDDDALVNWGRWEDYAPLDDQVIDRLQLPSLELVSKNSHFALFQPLAMPHTLPVSDSFSFDLGSYEALHVSNKGAVTATLTDATLTVDFTKAQFSTEMEVKSPSLSAPVSLFSQGNVGPLGQLVADAQFSNVDLSGIVTHKAQSVGMLLEHRLDDASLIVAATEWVVK